MGLETRGVGKSVGSHILDHAHGCEGNAVRIFGDAAPICLAAWCPITTQWVSIAGVESGP